MGDENVCYAQSRKEVALFWTTLAFFGGFAGVSAFGPIVSKLKDAMALSPLLMGLLAACPALSGSLLRIPFGAMVDRTGGKKPILILLGLAAAGIAGIMVMFYLYPEPQSDQYLLFLLFGILCGSGIAVFSVGIPTVSYWYPQKNRARRWPSTPGWETWPLGCLPCCCRFWWLPSVSRIPTFYGWQCWPSCWSSLASL